MNQAVLRRAQKLMQARSGSIATVHALSVAVALLTLALLVIVGLSIGLAATQGVTRLREPQWRLIQRGDWKLPAWFRDRLQLFDSRGKPLFDSRGVPLNVGQPPDVLVTDTGLYPLVALGRVSGNPVHRALAAGFDGLTRLIRPLHDNRGAVIALVMLGLLAALGLSLAERWRRDLAARAATRAAWSLRNQVHRQMYRLGQTYLPGEGLGPVVHIFTRDVNDVRDGLYEDLMTRVEAPALAAGLLLIALLVSPSLTLFVLALGGLVWLAARPLEQTRREQAESATRESAIHLLLLHEDLSMLRTVRVFGMETVDRRRFEEHLEHFLGAEERRAQADPRRHPVLLMMGGAAAVLTLGMFVHAVMTERVPLFAALLLAAVLAGLAWPLAMWLNRRRALAAATRAARGLFEFLERKPELQMTVGAHFLPPLRDQVRFESVVVEAPSGRTLLNSASATIPARSRTAILSLDGDAKHALVCLVPRLLDPKAGRVLADGIDLRDVTLESIRAQVAMILQADYVFSDSVINNIGLGDPSYTLPRIIEAAKFAHAHHLIQQLPQGYETVIGPLGHPLKLDEQYRIALARAYLHDPSIVIIEEPDTTLDDDIKHLIDDTIDRLAKGRTLIFLPHRLSTIRKCDQVIVLHNGRVEACGSPRDMHAQSKLYRHIQYVEFNQFASGEIEAGVMGSAG